MDNGVVKILLGFVSKGGVFEDGRGGYDIDKPITLQVPKKLCKEPFGIANIAPNTQIDCLLMALMSQTVGKKRGFYEPVATPQ